MRVYQLIRVSGGRPTATSGHRTAHRKRWDDLERIMRMVSSAIPIITFRYYPYKRKKLTFWVSLFLLVARAPKHTSSYIYNHVVIIKDTHRPFKKTSPQIPNYFIIFLFSPTEAIPQKQNNKDKNNCPQKKSCIFSS